MRAIIASALLLIAASTATADEPVSQSAPNAVVFDAQSGNAPETPLQSDTDGMARESVRYPSTEEEVVVIDGLQSLRWIAGSWRFRQSAAEGELEITGTVTARPGPGGHSMIVDTTIAAGPDKGTSIHEVIVPASDRGFVVYTFASNAVQAAIGEAFFDGRSLTWRRELEIDGKAVATEVTFERQSMRRATMVFESVTKGQRSAATLRVELMKRS